MAELAQRIQTLQCFVHVSTAYVNSFMPKGSWVDETVRPLVGRRSGVLDHRAVARELASLPSSIADQQASLLQLCFWLNPCFGLLRPPSICVQGAFYIKDVGLPNVYTFTKNLAEQLMLDLHAVDFPVSIVRPTIVSCLNGAPAPGYFGNNSGAIAFVMAFATGDMFASCLTLSHSLTVLDESFDSGLSMQEWLTTPVTTRTITSRM